MEEYRFGTDHRSIEMSIFDAEGEDFILMFDAGGLKVNSTLHPWVIVRVCTLQDRECKDLARRIRRLLDACAGAQQLLAGYRSLYAIRDERGARGTASMAPMAVSYRAGITEATGTQRSGGISRSGTSFLAMVIDIDNFSSGSDYADEGDSGDSTEDDSDGMELDEMELDELLEEDKLESAAEAATVVDHLTSGMTDMSSED